MPYKWQDDSWNRKKRMRMKRRPRVKIMKKVRRRKKAILVLVSNACRPVIEAKKK